MLFLQYLALFICFLLTLIDNNLSENLAIIYKNQGKTKKAIEIYEKLILKFPEKEAYFATRIEDLKKS